MIQVYDTTLRDGTQRAGISLSSADKIRIAQRLDELGFAFVEGGWPGSNPKDVEFFERARDMSWQTALIASFGRDFRDRPEARRGGDEVVEDGPDGRIVVGDRAAIATAGREGSYRCAGG